MNKIKYEYSPCSGDQRKHKEASVDPRQDGETIYRDMDRRTGRSPHRADINESKWRRPLFRSEHLEAEEEEEEHSSSKNGFK